MLPFKGGLRTESLLLLAGVTSKPRQFPVGRKDKLKLLLIIFFNGIYIDKIFRMFNCLRESGKSGELLTPFIFDEELRSSDSFAILSFAKDIALFLGAYEWALIFRLRLLQAASAGQFLGFRTSFSDELSRFREQYYAIIKLELSGLKRCQHQLEKRISQTISRSCAEHLIAALSDLPDCLDVDALRKGVAPMDPQRMEFENYIRGKKVAIIGPSSGLDEDDILLAKSCDIIIRLNYDGYETSMLLRHGVASHVSYINGSRARSFSPRGPLSDWIILRSPASDASKFRSLGCRVSRISTQPIEIFGDYNLLPIALLDLLPLGAESISVIGCDLYTSREPYASNYRSKSHLAQNPELFNFESSWMKIRVHHDPLMQYLLLSALHRSGSVKVTGRVAKVLDQNLLDYVGCLRRAHPQLLFQ